MELIKLGRTGLSVSRLVLASKVFSPPMEWGSPDPVKRSGSWAGANGRGLSARHIRGAVEASLKRLNTDHLDLYQMHHVDRGVPWDEVWQTMASTLLARTFGEL